MAVRILEVKKESCAAARFIGKRYENAPDWGEWHGQAERPPVPFPYRFLIFDTA